MNNSDNLSPDHNDQDDLDTDAQFSPLSISPIPFPSFSETSGSSRQSNRTAGNPLPPLEGSFLSTRSERRHSSFGFQGPSTSSTVHQAPILFNQTPSSFFTMMDQSFRKRNMLLKAQGKKSKFGAAAKKEPPESFELPTKTQMKIKIRRFVGVAEWKWVRKSTDDNCGICLHVFEACCDECKIPGEKCPLVEGVCTHSFHSHCIARWIRSHEQQQQRGNEGNPVVGRKQCPLCRQDWCEKSKSKMLSARNLM
ncbi:hypothetical protein QR680_001309 [Steinernema hermaphroditum]|uniref:Anaphase-promoting complex subunit 11 n=1 Tax=Steinernema hermaphroditum TaxID=289476 RepID=A0AA39GXR2_9BILA|nr:hypothetical protein QR680_001309 [Steinernema hermaphroditum]